MGTKITRYGTLQFTITVIGVLLLEYSARAFPFGYLVSTGLTRIMQGGLIVGVAFWWSDQTFLSGVFPSAFKKGFQRGAIWSLGFGVLAGVAGLGIHLAGVNPFELVRMRLPADSGKFVMFFLVAGIIGPIAEELFFRGTVYGFFRRWGVAPALLTSTVLFAMAHGVTGAGVIQVVGGIVFAAVYEFEENIIVPMVIHITGNLALFALGFLSGMAP